MAGSTRDTDATVNWTVEVVPGGVPATIPLVVGGHLAHGTGLGGHWKSLGERPVFLATDGSLPGRLPAGWYELEGTLMPHADAVLAPSIIPTYRTGMDGDAQIALHEPLSDGSLRALVLFKYDVVAFQFSPGTGAFEFDIGKFSLRRVGRITALRTMLGAVPNASGGPMASLVRAGRFIRDWLRSGISPATALAYADYRDRLNPHAATDYQEWARRFDTTGASAMEDCQRRLTALGEAAPLISILVPTYQTPSKWLRRCIESVINQAYPYWQLCIADDASPDPAVFSILREYSGRDNRIQVVRRDSNGHISEASNSALALAKGAWVALLDHDDELRPHALLEIAERIVGEPRLRLVYSDEDKIDLAGRRFDPYFKPDFDIDLLRGQNYLCHLTVIQADLVREVGGFRPGYEGSQDHDLFLRCVERLSPAEIGHVQKILYHWRAIPGSTALSRDAKDYAADAGVRAVADHLERIGSGATVEALSHGHYRVRWPSLVPAPLVSLIVPTRDRARLLRTCVDSILGLTRYGQFEVLVVDNGSSEPEALAYLADLEQVDRIRVLRDDAPFNYSRLNNWAVRQAKGTVIGLVNNDIEVISPEWLDEMVSHASRPGVGAVGAMLYYPNDLIQHAGVVLGIDGVAAHIYSGMPRGYAGHGGRARVAQGMSAVTAACMVVTRAAFEAVGGLDESLEVAFNDIDFCLRLREAGYRNVWTPFAEMYHHESASRGQEDTDEKKARFAREVELMRSRWGAILHQDPAYNVNLSLTSRYFELAVPPRATL